MGQPIARVAPELIAFLLAQQVEQRSLVVIELVSKVRIQVPVVLEQLLACRRFREPGTAQLVGRRPTGADVARVRFIGAFRFFDLQVVDRLVELLGGEERLARVAVKPRQ